MKTKEKITPLITANNWKQFVITCCELNIKNTSQQIADTINRNTGLSISAGSVSATKANWTRKKIN